jgi:outer membrane protein
MKRLTIFVACAIVATFGGSICSAQDALKYAFVDQEAFVMKSKKAMGARQKLQELYAQKQQELEKRKSDIMALEEEIKRQGPMLKEDKRDEKLRELGQKQLEFQLAERQAQTVLQNEQRDAMQSLRKDLQKVIHDIRKKRDLIMVFDRVALLDVEESLDLTDEVAKLYDGLAPGAEAKPPAAEKPKPGAAPTPAPVAPAPKAAPAPKPPPK